MKNFLQYSLLTCSLFIMSSFSLDRIDYRDGRHKNVCKQLKDKVLVYLIFVDSKETAPWTEFDIQSTLDSLAIAVEWLEKQARNYGISLHIITDYFIGPTYTTIKKKLPQKTVYESIYTPGVRDGIKSINEWADKVAREAGSYLPMVAKDGIPEIENPRNKERLIAYLRDRHMVESVALLYMVNNYFKDDISIPINTMNTKDVEFALVSYKYPSEIAHNILHLFGAADLFETPLRRSKTKIEMAKKLFPNDIMQDPYARNINSLEIGSFTRYLIGWLNELRPEEKELLKDNAKF